MEHRELVGGVLVRSELVGGELVGGELVRDRRGRRELEGVATSPFRGNPRGPRRLPRTGDARARPAPYPAGQAAAGRTAAAFGVCGGGR